jgi:hypothetical protein
VCQAKRGEFCDDFFVDNIVGEQLKCRIDISNIEHKETNILLVITWFVILTMYPSTTSKVNTRDVIGEKKKRKNIFGGVVIMAEPSLLQAP